MTREAFTKEDENGTKKTIVFVQKFGDSILSTMVCKFMIYTENGIDEIYCSEANFSLEANDLKDYYVMNEEEANFYFLKVIRAII